MSVNLKVLLIEDDLLISKTLKMSLSYEGFDLIGCSTLKQGYEVFNSQDFDVILLDRNLPDGDGINFCQKIRKANLNIPILMITAKTEESAAVQSFEAGVDDYIRKPFGIQELTTRMKRLIERRSHHSVPIKFGLIRIDQAKRMAWSGDNELNLGKKEFDILALLVKKSGEVVSRNEILDTLGEEAEIYDRTIDSHLSHLRKKLRDTGAYNVQITPVYGVGYRMEEKK